MKTPTILIIDDDVVLLARLATQLKDAGYETVQATSVRQAEYVLDSATVDLALLEPAIDRQAGWEFLPRLAARTPTIVISGDGLEEDVVRGLDAGAVDYLTKPFRTGELLARLRAHLKSRSTHEIVPSQDTPSTNPTASAASPATASRVIDLGDDDDIADDATAAVANTHDRHSDSGGSTKRLRRARPSDDEEEAVFIPHAEERGLIADHTSMPVDELRVAELEQLPLGARLRAARQRRRITLVQAELDTKIRMSYIQAMEEEKFSLLPHGCDDRSDGEDVCRLPGIECDPCARRVSSAPLHCAGRTSVRPGRNVAAALCATVVGMGCRGAAGAGDRHWRHSGDRPGGCCGAWRTGTHAVCAADCDPDADPDANLLANGDIHTDCNTQPDANKHRDASSNC
jgi:CheY-like chemotaxis protein